MLAICVQAADFFNDQSTLAEVCRFAASWLFPTHSDCRNESFQENQQNRAKMSKDRLRVCVWSMFVSCLSNGVPANCMWHAPIEIYYTLQLDFGAWRSLTVQCWSSTRVRAHPGRRENATLGSYKAPGCT